MHELGWIEGHTIAIEYRWAEGRSARLAEIAAEFVRLGVDVIFATGTAPALAAKQATSMIPIVFPTGYCASAGVQALSTDEARRAFDERIERLLSQHGVDYVRGYVDALKDASSGGSQARGLRR